MEDIKKLIKNLDKLANIIIEGYKSHEPIYRNLECIIEKGEYSCKILNSIDIKRRENIIEAMLNVCSYITEDNGSCNLIIHNYSGTSEITRRKIEFTLDEINRIKIIKYYKPYTILIEGLKYIKGLIQISVYISY
jgi:hypothetical protein